MFGADIDETIIVEQKRALEAAISTNPDTVKVLRRVIRKIIIEARAEVVDSIHFQNGDPRNARQSVRSAVYKKILGANLNIYNSRKVGSKTVYERPRKLRPGQWGGNRLPRSEETQKMLNYGALNRGFVLRFVNDGTGTRTTRFGNRGSITARHFFKHAGERALTEAADKLSEIVENELTDLLDKKR